MSTHEAWKAPIKCANPSCNNTMGSHALAVIKTSGWFHQRDGTSWCPEHIPEWVAKWREDKAESKARRERFK